MKCLVQQNHPHTFLFTGSLLFLLLLTACSTGNSNKMIAKIKPTPAPQLITYQGNGYTIGYPQGWSAKGKGSLVTFTAAQSLTAFIIEEIPNPDGVISPATAVYRGLNDFKVPGTNLQKIAITPTLTLGGNTWDEGAALADTAAHGQGTHLKLVVLSSDYPQKTASTHTFTLLYATPSKEFDQINTQCFQRMLQSFKFA